MSERDVLRTIIAEAGGNPDGMAAVANVINNRSVAWHMTPYQVVSQGNGSQFEGFNHPGPAIAKQLDDPKLLEQARQIWDGVQNGSTADPTNGGLYYHAAYINPGWQAPHGTVQIGGNLFYKGNAQPQAATAADEINRIVPIPALQQQAQEMAYADQPKSSTMPLPIARPRLPSDVGSLLPPPMAQLDPLLASGEAFDGNAAGASGTLFPGLPALMDAAINGPPEATSNFNTPGYSNGSGLTSRAVQTVPIDSLTGNPESSQQQLQAAVQSLASQRASNAASWQGLLTPAPARDDTRLVADAAPNVVSDATRDPASEQLNSPSDSFLSDLQNYAARAAAQQNGGWLKTANPEAGNVALPPGVVPQSVQQDLPFVSSLANGQSWGNAVNSIFGPPLISPPTAENDVRRLQPSSAAIGSGDGLSAPQVASIGSGGANQGTGSLLPNEADAYALPGSSPALTAINSATSYKAPTTAYTIQQMTEKNPAYEAYIAAQKADDIGAGIGSFSNLGSNLSGMERILLAPPPQYITVARRIAVPAATAAARPALVAPPPPPPPPAGAPGTTFLQARGVNVTPNTPAPVVANDLRAALAGSSQRGSFGV
jgi:hypothetical protein